MGIKEVSISLPAREQPTDFWKSADIIARDAVLKTDTQLPLQEFSMRLFETTKTIVNHGHTGRTSLDGKKIIIGLNPSFSDSEKLLHVELPRSISHELHHSTRFQLLGAENNLKESVIAEGLAVQFETEVWGGEPSAWAKALTDDQISMYKEMFLNEISSPGAKYDHGAWFYGTTGQYPRWMGYSLGFHIVNEYLKLHPDQTAASLVATPADSILAEVIK